MAQVVLCSEPPRMKSKLSAETRSVGLMSPLPCWLSSRSNAQLLLVAHIPGCWLPPSPLKANHHFAFKGFYDEIGPSFIIQELSLSLSHLCTVPLVGSIPYSQVLGVRGDHLEGYPSPEHTSHVACKEKVAGDRVPRNTT